MLEDSVIMFDFMVEKLKIKPENIILFGRSIGSGPATYLASKRKNIKMLLLFSPFTNLKAIVKDYFSILSVFVKDRFPNIEYIKEVTAPLLIIHGQQDKIVKVDHSEKLMKAGGMKYKKLLIPPKMNHNNYRLYDDLIIPLCQFLKIIQVNKNYKLKIDKSKNSEPVKSNKKIEPIVLKKLRHYKSDYVFLRENAIYNSFDSKDSDDSFETLSDPTLERDPDMDRMHLTQSNIRKKEHIKKLKIKYPRVSLRKENKIRIFDKKDSIEDIEDLEIEGGSLYGGILYISLVCVCLICWEIWR